MCARATAERSVRQSVVEDFFRTSLFCPRSPQTNHPLQHRSQIEAGRWGATSRDRRRQGLTRIFVDIRLSAYQGSADWRSLVAENVAASHGRGRDGVSERQAKKAEAGWE